LDSLSQQITKSWSADRGEAVKPIPKKQRVPHLTGKRAGGADVRTGFKLLATSIHWAGWSSPLSLSEDSLPQISSIWIFS
jgi:hypothetical protein